MTGEVTLTGRVLPVGGVREKILAARRAGIKTVLLPRHNEKDLVDIPAEVKADLTLRFVDTLDDVVPRLFETRSPRNQQPPSRPRQAGAPRSREPSSAAARRTARCSIPSRPADAGRTPLSRVADGQPAVDFWLWHPGRIFA